MEKISVIVLNYNGIDDTIECLQSLSKVNVPPNFTLEVIVVDNSSNKNSDEIIKSEFKNVILIQNKENLGFSGGNNVGIRYALDNGAKYVVILNNDTLVDKEFVGELLKVAESDNKIGVISPKIYFAPGFEFHKDKYKSKDLGKVFWYGGGIMDFNNIIGYHRGVDEVDNGQYDKTQITDFASGCCMLVKKEVFDKIGLFDDDYFLYYEDNDLCIRAKNANFSIAYAPKAIIWHKNAGSAGGSGSKLQDYYITRNRMLFGMRYASIRVKIALIKESLKIFIRGRKWQRKGIMDFYFKKIGKGSFINE